MSVLKRGKESLTEMKYLIEIKFKLSERNCRKISEKLSESILTNPKYLVLMIFVHNKIVTFRSLESLLLGDFGRFCRLFHNIVQLLEQLNQMFCFCDVKDHHFPPL